MQLVDVWSSTRVHEAMVAEAIGDVESADVPHMWSCVERRLHSLSRWRLAYSSPWHGTQAVDHTWTHPDNVSFASELSASSAPISSKWKTLISDVQRSIANANDCLAERGYDVTPQCPLCDAADSVHHRPPGELNRCLP